MRPNSFGFSNHKVISRWLDRRGVNFDNGGVPVGNTEQRSLAAIMFTDMVAYGSLSQRSEAFALELLAENQRL